MRITSWNINSVRIRLEAIAHFVNIHRPDILCLQETKVVDNEFPYEALKQLGFSHFAIKGEKSYNGVAIISKIPFKNIYSLNFANKDDARHIAVQIDDDIEIHNFYVPAGGDIPDPLLNPKFKHKLDFLDHATSWFTKNRTQNDKIILVGDLNIAPLENDVWSHKQLLDVVSHTPIEVQKLTQWQNSLPFTDLVRKFVPAEQKLYSWWSYRNRDWKKSNRGRRLDHIWSSTELALAVKQQLIYDAAREFKSCSDHAPVSCWW